MELLIPGLILVAFMVWASTRIKKNAAAAFDAEIVRTDEFSIRKPEGFLHVLNDSSGLAFRAYSKEFGKIGNREVRRATIEVEEHPDTKIDQVKRTIEGISESIELFEAYQDGGERAARLASTQVVDGGQYHVVRKLVTRGGKVVELRGMVLSDHRDEFIDALESASDSFKVK